ncbi:MAG: hypothetical protein AB2A00_09860 [Myxococcota bacterium]
MSHSPETPLRHEDILRVHHGQLPDGAPRWAPSADFHACRAQAAEGGASVVNAVRTSSSPRLPAVDVTPWQEQPAPAADRLLREVSLTSMTQLRGAAEALVRLPPDERVRQLVQRVCAGGAAATAAVELLRLRPGLAVAEALRVFPGPLRERIFDEAPAELSLEELCPLTRLLLRLGPRACALASAHGGRSGAPATRYVAVLLAGGTAVFASANIVAQCLGDDEARVAYLAAVTLRRMRECPDDRARGVRALVSTLRNALEHGTDLQRLAVVRAATFLPDAALWPGLVALVGRGEEPVASLALAALRHATGQDHGTQAGRWQHWLKQGAPANVVSPWRSALRWLRTGSAAA